ncbi:MAG: ABC transporter ATP-binding protein [Clostridium sp.]|uniref:ABC transporter ATP-binding protein n=1 Tax=Clostridium sp. TaxID=1506 RepID=UPI003EE7AB9E
MGDYAVRFKNLVKEYKLYKNDKDRFKDLFWGKRYTPFKAVDNLTLDLPKGEVIGILGKNGSGKSTILKMVTGVVYPTSGQIEVNGRVSALLELTAGFDGELTGKENIYLKGYSMGMDKSGVEEIIHSIIDFSELGEYINQPVRMYSSGMKARLGFAIAVNINPDILVVDEALAVGDEMFRDKCLKRMDKFRDEGKTILFVSHSLPQMRNFCTKGAWLYKGKLIDYGDIDEIANLYKHFLNGVDIKDIIENKHKYKDLIEIKQSLTDIEMKEEKISFKGYVSLEPLGKEYKIDNISLVQDGKSLKFKNIFVKKNKDEKLNRLDYDFNLSFKDIEDGAFNFEINIDVNGENYNRQAWCTSKFGQFVNDKERVEVIIKSNRLKIKRMK